MFDLTLTPHQFYTLLQLSDSMFPSGAFAHSGGLETYIQQGIVKDGETLKQIITTRLLESAATSEMVIVHSAMEMPERIVEMDELSTAAKTALEAREVSVKVGRRLLQSVLAILDDEILQFYAAEVSAGQCAGHHAIVAGLTYRTLAISPPTALLAFAYGMVANQVSAAVKLMSLGQTQAQQIIAQMQPFAEQAVVIALNTPLEDYHAFTPALDIRVMQHQYLFRRLFIS